MIDALRWWLSFRRSANFSDWVRASYSKRELERLSQEATDESLIRPYDPLGDQSWSRHLASEASLRKTAHRLLRRYGDEIWSACLGAGGYDSQKGPFGLSCLSRLGLSGQVYNQATFEEFLVRNALRQTARQVLGQTT